MTIDLSTIPTARPWEDPNTYWPALTDATARLDPPLAVLNLDALRYNAHDMLRRAEGMPIRVAAKSVRVRGVLDAVLALPGYAGVLAYTLPEALWLATETDGHPAIEDIVVAYPSADRGAIAQLAASADYADRITLMVDSLTQLDLIDSVVPPTGRVRIRVCLELDASWNSKTLGHVGVWRSSVHSPAAARILASRIAAREGFELVGMMAYEAQIAGQGNAPRERPLWGVTVRWMQRNSELELRERRAAAVAAVREVADLRFVNGGGTGSLEFTSSDAAVTEIGAGSGLLGGHLFDNYRDFTPAPATAFALSVVRRPTSRIATVLGGGWIASGPPGSDRLPLVAWPTGLEYVPRESAGEVQTPVSGVNAALLATGDRVWFRHTKSGELSEHVTEFVLVESDAVVGTLATYRGQGKAFL